MEILRMHAWSIFLLCYLALGILFAAYWFVFTKQANLSDFRERVIAWTVFVVLWAVLVVFIAYAHVRDLLRLRQFLKIYPAALAQWSGPHFDRTGYA